MYCPECGQQQVSNEMRFCSRCGLSLNGLAEWLAGGTVPAIQSQVAGAAGESPRRKGIRRAAKLMFFSGALFVVFLVISLAVDDGGPMVVPCAVFFVALVMMLYARLFADKNPPIQTPVVLTPALQTPTFLATAARSSLPPATNLATPPIGRQQVRTNELAQPPSVTDNTTRLLDE